VPLLVQIFVGHIAAGVGGDLLDQLGRTLVGLQVAAIRRGQLLQEVDGAARLGQGVAGNLMADRISRCSGPWLAQPGWQL
jgi:hypothetical protein